MNLIETLFPKARAEIIRLLFAVPDQSLHLREIVRLSGLAVRTVQTEIGKLCKAGLLLERRDGNRLYFSANRENPIFSELRGIAIKTTGLVDHLKEALSGFSEIDLACVYGSMASGEADSGSDIDVLIVGSIGLRKLAPRLRKASEFLGREINPSVMSKDTFRKKARSDDAYINNILNFSKLWIKGSDDELAKLAE